MTGNRLIPKYQNASGALEVQIPMPSETTQQLDERTNAIHTAMNIDLARHTDPDTGEINPAYDAWSNSYGTYRLPEIQVWPEFKNDKERRTAFLKADAKKGENYYHQGMKEAQPFINAVIAPIVFTAGMEAPIWASELAFVASNPDNPLSYLPVAGRAFGGLYNWADMVERRGLETIVRTVGAKNSGFNPVPSMKYLWNNDRQRIRDIGRYVLTGKRTGQKGYYNSFQKDPDQYYSGFSQKAPDYISESNDLVDAFLFGEEISPKFGLKLMRPEYGIHSDYIRQFYPNKKIPVYQPAGEVGKHMEEPRFVWRLPSLKGEGLIGYMGPQRKLIYYDAGGFRYDYVRDADNIFIRNQDIWKFEPEAFENKYNLVGPNKFINRLVKFGLRRLNAKGTPLIFRTGWRKYPGSLLGMPKTKQPTFPLSSTE